MLYCKRCGGTDLWTRTWTNVNTGAVDDLGELGDPFCRDCDKKTSAVEEKPAVRAAQHRRPR